MVISYHPPPATYAFHEGGRLSPEQTPKAARWAPKQVGQWYVHFHEDLLLKVIGIFLRSLIINGDLPQEVSYMPFRIADFGFWNEDFKMGSIRYYSINLGYFLGFGFD